MRVFILSVDHGEQLLPTEADNLHVVEGKTRLTQRVPEIIEERDIDLICEESDPNQTSIAQEEAAHRDPEIPWKNIVMTQQERTQAGIAEALANRPSHPVEIDGVFRSVEHRIPEDHIREEFFKDEIIQEAESKGAESALVLCGDMHTQALEAKLEEAEHEVEIDRSLTPIQLWE